MRTIQEIIGEMDDGEFAINCLDYKFFAERVLGLIIKPFHLDWINLIQSGEKRIAIQAPTGFGKTEILGRAYCLWRSYTGKGIDMCIVSKTLPQARKILYEIKNTIENNELLRDLIPSNKQ